jgi:hypothetical protein
MSGLNYVGATPAGSQDEVTKLAMAGLLAAATPSQGSAATDVNNAAALMASKTYIDTQAANYETPSYYQTQDALNIALTKIGVAGGVAALDATTKIPLVQLPSVGAGYIKGPFGPTAGFAVTGTTSTPQKIADWNIGVQSLTFMPWVMCSIMVQSLTPLARPVVEIRMSNGSAVYASQTFIARGLGRSLYTSAQSVAVVSAPTVTGATGPGTAYSPTYNIWLSAWLYDANNAGVEAAQNSVTSGAVYLVRTAQ